LTNDTINQLITLIINLHHSSNSNISSH